MWAMSAIGCFALAAFAVVPGHAQDQPPAAAAAASDAKAREVLNSVCTACHDLGMLTARRHAAAEWPVILQQMVGNGANLSDDDFKLLETYLAKTYSAPAG